MTTPIVRLHHVTAIGGDPQPTDSYSYTAERERREAALDETIEQSFPASDPPSSDPNPDNQDIITLETLGRHLGKEGR